MGSNSSRRAFLAAGLALPAAAAVSKRSGGTGTPVFRPISDSEPQLRYRKLGKTGLKVTEVGFGCLVTSDPSVIEAAADIGINLFDTARSYQSGNNERLVGSALKSRRKDVLISTKTGSRNAKGALADLETSLRELGTDYIDIWYLHGRRRPSDITDELLEVMEKAKKDGKVRFTGFSTHNGMKELLRQCAGKPHIDVILTTYNFTMDEDMAAAIAEARSKGTGVVAMKVMAGGFRKIRPGHPLYEKFQKDGTMLAALKWVLADKNVDSTIPSMKDMAELEENLRAMSSPLTEDDRKLLARQLDYIRPLYCRTCGACEGKCPKGLPVSDMLRHLSYAEGYGQFQLARENFLELPAQVRAVRCTDCAECAVECPNGVRVAERLSRAQELLA